MVGQIQGMQVVSEQDERLIASLGIESLWLRRESAARRLLIVLAHPDDESFGIGSTIARYAGEGVSVHYACATRGECGEVAPALLADYEDAGSLRTAELTCAAYALDLAAVATATRTISRRIGPRWLLSARRAIRRNIPTCVASWRWPGKRRSSTSMSSAPACSV